MATYNKTRDYEKFNFFTFNRPLNESLVKKLMESIQAIGYLDASVITVDPHYNIIDGQHRFTACMRLGKDIVYTISNVNPHEAVIKMNANQVNWSLADYVHAWAEQGVKCYKYIESFESIHKFSTVLCLHMCANSTIGTKTIGVKKGITFPINPNAEKIANYIKSCNNTSY